MRKGRWLLRLIKKGYQIPFAADDPQRPDRARVNHPQRPQKNLARCRDLLQKGKTALGLQKLNNLAAIQNSPARTAQIASLAADSEFKLGHFNNAISGYRAAAAFVNNDPRAWVRPALAEVRALLKAARTDEAHSKATATWNKSLAQHEETQREAALQAAHFLHTGKVLIKKRPYRASVVASRLGYLFLLEGETVSAKEFFSNALIVNPQGGSRARQGLAMIALAEGNLADAQGRAREALLLGKFQAKTIGVWQTLIAARQQQGIKGIDGDLLAGVQQSTKSTVRARAIFAIVNALRRYQDPAWENIAASWLAQQGSIHPVIATELRKLANAKLRLSQDNSSGQASSAAQLLSKPELLSRAEYVAATKQYVRGSLLSGASVDMAALVQQGVTLYGNGCRNRLSHDLALSCMMAKRHDLARPLLQAVVASSKKNSQWGKSLWALARMEAVLGNNDAAATLFNQFANDADQLLRFRLQARIKWLTAVIASGNVSAAPLLHDALLATCQQIDDYEVLLDFGRQLTHAPASIRDVAKDFLARGEQLAISQFAAAQSPSVAIGILFRLTRRQVYDFGKYERAVAFWRGLTPQKRDWLWTEKSEFWEYISWVFVAMTKSKLQVEAEALLQQYLQDSATPIDARVRLMSKSASWKIRAGNVVQGMAVYSSMISISPSHRLCAEGYYWLALQAKNNGNDPQAMEYAKQIQTALGSRKGLLAEWQLDCKANLIRSGLTPGTALQSSNYDLAFQNQCLASIQSDRGKL